MEDQRIVDQGIAVSKYLNLEKVSHYYISTWTKRNIRRGIRIKLSCECIVTRHLDKKLMLCYWHIIRPNSQFYTLESVIMSI